VEFANYFPIWNKLNPGQQERISAASQYQKVKSGTVLHDGSPECLGMLLVKSGQLRAYILSEEGREVTICRFFEMDICLFSAACVMPNMQFNIIVEAEKDSVLFTSIPYMRGWELLVDGERVEKLSIAKDGVIGAFIPAGRHTVTMRYRQRVLLPALLISPLRPYP